MTRAIKCNRLAGQHDRTFMAATHTQRANAMGVTKSYQTMACYQRNHSIGALDTAVDATHGLKHIHGLEGQTTCSFLQLVGQHIQ